MSAASDRREALALELTRVRFDHARDDDASEGPRAPALRDVALRVAAGERVALLGPNGAGKTTLLWLAAGLLEATEGSVAVGGLALRGRTRREALRGVALVFADPEDMLFCPTALDEVAFAPLRAGRSRGDAEARARALLAQVGLEDRATREPLSLSLGEKKRLALAAALATEAPLVLLDEPTASLDPRARRQLLALLRSLPCALVVATHDLDAACALEARAVVLDGGRLVHEGDARALRDDAALLERHGLA